MIIGIKSKIMSSISLWLRYSLENFGEIGYFKKKNLGELKFVISF